MPQTTPGEAAPRLRAPRGRASSRQQVLATALELIDDEGMEALTIRRLAAELSIGVTTVYGYVRTKEEILDGVTSLALEAVRLDPARQPQWPNAIRAYLHALYSALRAHPGATQVIASGRTPGAPFDDFREAGISALEAAGFPKRDAVTSLSALYSYVVGFAATAGDPAGRQTQDLARVKSLPSERYPALIDAAAEFSSRFSNEAFEFGLDRLLEGLLAWRSLADAN